MTRRFTTPEELAALDDGTVAADRFGGVWVVEEWWSVATGVRRRERCWYTTGDKKSYSDDEVAEMGPMRVLRLSQQTA